MGVCNTPLGMSGIEVQMWEWIFSFFRLTVGAHRRAPLILVPLILEAIVNTPDVRLLKEVGHLPRISPALDNENVTVGES